MLVAATETMILRSEGDGPCILIGISSIIGYTDLKASRENGHAPCGSSERLQDPLSFESGSVYFRNQFMIRKGLVMQGTGDRLVFEAIFIVF